MKEGWRTVTIGDVVDLRQGLAFNKKNNHLMVGVGIPLLRITDLISRTETKFVDPYEVPEKFISKPTDLIYTRTGQVGLIFKGRIGVVHNNCFRIIPCDEVDRDYVYFYLRQQWVIDYARTLATGAAQPDLSHNAFKSIKFLLPPLPTQRRIASILSAYDDLIENNTRRVAILEEMARRLYEEWFIHFRFPGYGGVKMVESEIGPVPEGWEVKALSEIATVNAGSIKKATAPSEIHYIDIKSVSTGRVESTRNLSFSEAPSRARRVVRGGDILWSAVRPNLRAYALILDPLPNTIASTGFAVISPRQAPFSFLYPALTTDEFVEYLVNHATGAAYPAVNQKDFEAAKFAVPSDDVLEASDRLVQPLLLLVRRLEAKNTNLRTQRDLLLPKLISGEIDVSELGKPMMEAAAE